MNRALRQGLLFLVLGAVGWYLIWMFLLWKWGLL